MSLSYVIVPTKLSQVDLDMSKRLTVLARCWDLSSHDFSYRFD